MIRMIKEANPGDYVVRVNVMIPRKNFKFFGKSLLQMEFFTEDVKEAETYLIFYENQGASGKALHDNEQVYFDSERTQDQYRGMTPIQRDITRDVKSILSTPIYSPSDEGKSNLIGILNFDSFQSIATTKFDTEEIRNIGSRFAEIIGSFLTL